MTPETLNEILNTVPTSPSSVGPAMQGRIEVEEITPEQLKSLAARDSGRFIDPADLTDVKVEGEPEELSLVVDDSAEGTGMIFGGDKNVFR